MLAIDTNVIVRLVVDDNHEQFLRANRVLASQPVFVSNTVLLECEWVLRSAYRLEANDFVAAVRRLAGLANVTLEDPELADNALRWHENGMDFADAMHVARAANCDGFVSFDKGLAKAAAKVGAMRVQAP